MNSIVVRQEDQSGVENLEDRLRLAEESVRESLGRLEEERRVIRSAESALTEK